MQCLKFLEQGCRRAALYYDEYSCQDCRKTLLVLTQPSYYPLLPFCFWLRDTNTNFIDIIVEAGPMVPAQYCTWRGSRVVEELENSVTNNFSNQHNKQSSIGLKSGNKNEQHAMFLHGHVGRHDVLKQAFQRSAVWPLVRGPHVLNV